MGQEPSLSVFFWFFTLRWVDKGASLPIILEISRPSRSQLTGIIWKVHSSRSATPALGGAIVEASPLATAGLTEESTLPPLVIVLDSAEVFPMPVVVRGSALKRAVEEGALQSQERPLKRTSATEAKASSAKDFNFLEFFGVDQGEGDETWVEVKTSRSSSASVWNPRYPIGEVVDRRLSCFTDQEKAKELGLPKSLEVIQRYARYSLILARAMEREFEGLVAHQQSLDEKNQKAHDALLNLSAEYEATTTLQSDLDRVVVETKELRLVQQDLESLQDYFKAQNKVLGKEKEALTSTKAATDEEMSWLTQRLRPETIC
ncbi:hypothetical protein CR513_45184, partial [Mucuna pruriens]